MRLPNYIKDTNPFNLAGPPVWWLDKLHEFDNSLVVVPSRVGFYYRLAQRRTPDLRTNIVNDILKDDSDTRMLYRLGLIPVTTILSTTDWSNPAMWEELRRRAPWRQGGSGEFMKKLESQEKEDALKAAIEQNDKLDYLARDSWKYYQKQLGLRSNVYVPKTQGTNKPEVRTGIRRVAPTTRYRPDLVSNWGNPRLFPK